VAGDGACNRWNGSSRGADAESGAPEGGRFACVADVRGGVSMKGRRENEEGGKSGMGIEMVGGGLGMNGF
jgi:hypothetical protein